MDTPRTELLTAAFAAVALLAVPCVASAQPDDRDQLLQGVRGQWRLSVDQPERRIDRAIEEGTEDLGFPLRGIARGRLGDIVDAEERVSVRVEGRHVIVSLGSWGPVRLPLNGRYVQADDAGEQITARAMVRHGSLVIQQRNGHGTRTVYLRPRRNVLVATMRISSERLPDDIVYRLRYRRS